MRIVLHTGKGGVGKTTVSAATAIAAADAGHRTLLLSTDPAHSVADVLSLPVDGDPAPVDGVPGLWAAQLDVRARFEQAWSGLRSYLVTMLAARGVSQVQAEELTVLPGADEIIALLELQDHAASGRFGVIVVDCAPTGETVRLLALPETIAFYADRLLSTPARLLRGLGSLLPRGLTGPGAAAPGENVRDALGELIERVRGSRELLTDTAIASTRLVMTPERVVVAEARRLWTALALHGYAVDTVVVNRVLPAEVSGTLFDGWRRAQQRALAQARESFPVPLLVVEQAGQEPIGVDALRKLGQGMFAGADPVALPAEAAAAGLQVRQDRGRYLLRIALPLAEHGQVELARADDDLVITVGSLRRRLTLPSLLRRCTSVGARFDEDTLEVEFVPDPRLWPDAVLPPATESVSPAESAGEADAVPAGSR